MEWPRRRYGTVMQQLGGFRGIKNCIGLQFFVIFCFCCIFIKKKSLYGSVMAKPWKTRWSFILLETRTGLQDFHIRRYFMMASKNKIAIRRFLAFGIDWLVIAIWAGTIFGIVMLSFSGQPPGPSGPWRSQAVGIHFEKDGPFLAR